MTTWLIGWLFTLWMVRYALDKSDIKQTFWQEFGYYFLLLVTWSMYLGVIVSELMNEKDKQNKGIK